MTTIYRGVVKDRVVVLPEGVELPEDTMVEILAPSAGEETALPEDLTPLERALLEAGLIREVKRPPRTLPTEDYEPIQVQGVPLSQAVLDERR